MQKSLIAFDTDHIKRYVFASDKLKEVRGASSILDHLNRDAMAKIAKKPDIDATPIYMNGGSGLFIVDTSRAKEFGKRVQDEYRKRSHGGASITYTIQGLPPDAPEDIEELKKYPIPDSLELMRLKLRENKNHPPDLLALPSHPFLRPCDACGIEYAETRLIDQDQPGEELYYCKICWKKQHEDEEIKREITKHIKDIRTARQTNNQQLKQIGDQLISDGRLWPRVLGWLAEVGYDFGTENVPERPNDFDIFRDFTETKDYLGFIYADANNMGKVTDGFTTLIEHERFAKEVDDAIHKAMARAIKKHLPLVAFPQRGTVLFPFDILLLGGDDIIMVTDAAKAMDVALTIAQEFRSLTAQKYTLSVGVVLFPVKYPFGLLQDLAASTLKFAKKDSAEARKVHEEDDSRINFMVVTGGVLQQFDSYLKKDYIRENNASLKKEEFRATMRSYAPDDLAHLLATIRKGRELNLGRTKLHQLREAILKLNATTAVSEGLATLRNWSPRQRSHVLKQVYLFGERHPEWNSELQSNPNDAVKGFPRVIFPWSIREKDGKKIYRTSLLDFVELYDFVGRKEDQQS